MNRYIDEGRTAYERYRQALIARIRAGDTKLVFPVNPYKADKADFEKAEWWDTGFINAFNFYNGGNDSE